MRLRGGFTLVELLFSIVLLALVGGIGIRLLLRQHWTGVAQGDRGAMQTGLRAGLLFLTTELRELGGTGGDADILAFAPESLTYRAMRGSGFSCLRGQNLVALDAARFRGYRAIQPGRDSLLLHQENREDTSADDAWLHLPVLSVTPGSCGTAPALLIGTTLDTTLVLPGSLARLAPVRTYEIMQVRLYQSAGDYWLGARSVSAGETIQPLVGPLTSQGLALGYQDSAGVVATSAAAIRRITIVLRGVSAGATRTTGGFGAVQRWTDSLATAVALRNW